MKFGKKWRSLVHDPWLQSYVDYNALKKVLKREAPPEGHFKFKSNLSQALKVCDAFYAATVTLHSASLREPNVLELTGE